jgi:hypothetical protein
MSQTKSRAMSDKCSEAIGLVKSIWLPCQVLSPTFTPSDRTYRACAPSSEVLNPIKATLGVPAGIQTQTWTFKRTVSFRRFAARAGPIRPSPRSDAANHGAARSSAGPGQGRAPASGFRPVTLHSLRSRMGSLSRRLPCPATKNSPRNPPLAAASPLVRGGVRPARPAAGWYVSARRGAEHASAPRIFVREGEEGASDDDDDGPWIERAVPTEFACPFGCGITSSGCPRSASILAWGSYFF